MNFSFDSSVPTDICSLDTTVRADAADNCAGLGTSSTASVTCPVASSPAIAVTQNCPGGPAVPGALTTFSGLVSNTGNVTLNNVTVVSKLAGTEPIFGPVSLAPGQSADFTGSYTIAAGTTSCTYESQVTASGADKCTGKVVSADNKTSCPIQTSPGIAVSLTCPDKPVAQGKTMTYKARVQNTGTGSLQVNVYIGLSVGKSVFSKNSMAPGEVREFNVSVTVPNDCCTVSTTLLAIGVDGCSKAEVQDTATATCPVLFKPAIQVTKVCQPSDIEQSLQPGDNMFNTGTVKNTGDVTLVDVTLVNNINGVPTTFLGPISLAPDQVVNYKTTFLIPPDFCGDNAIIATGHPLCDDTITVTDSANTKSKILTMPMITVEKICPTLPVSAGNVFSVLRPGHSMPAMLRLPISLS